MGGDLSFLGAPMLHQGLDAISVEIVRKFASKLGSVTLRCFLGRISICILLFIIYAREGRNGCDAFRYVTRYVIRYGFGLFARTISGLSLGR